MTTNTFFTISQPTFTAIVPNAHTFTPPNMSKKRSRQTLDSAPPSPTPTRTASKRLQSRHPERPTWVTSASKSISLRPILNSTGLDSHLYPTIPSSPQHQQERGCRVLCFLGSTTTHLTALASISHLLLSSFHTPIFAISLTPPPSTPISTIPILHDSARTLTLQLGLLHPLGGGRIALDAVVVLDREGRRRMLLPVGWGVRSCGGREMGHLVGGEGGIEVENVLLRLVKGVEWLCGEGRSGADGEEGEGEVVSATGTGTGEEADVDMDR